MARLPYVRDDEDRIVDGDAATHLEALVFGAPRRASHVQEPKGYPSSSWASISDSPGR